MQEKLNNTGVRYVNQEHITKIYMDKQRGEKVRRTLVTSAEINIDLLRTTIKHIKLENPWSRWNIGILVHEILSIHDRLALEMYRCIHEHVTK